MSTRTRETRSSVQVAAGARPTLFTRLWAALAGVLCLLVLGAPSAQAQLSRDGGPIDYSADLLEYQDTQNILVLSGNVDITQDDARLQANKLSIYLSGQSTGGANSVAPGDIDRIVAEGDVHYVRSGQTVRGDVAVYETKIDTVTFTGNVVAANRDNLTRGEILIMEISSGAARFNPGKVPGKRVQGRINPQKVNPAAPPTP